MSLKVQGDHSVCTEKLGAGQGYLNDDMRVYSCLFKFRVGEMAQQVRMLWYELDSLSAVLRTYVKMKVEN